MKNRILIYQLLILVMLAITANSCKKDDPIVKKDVDIIWANPAEIVSGTPLSSTQLNATADVAGTFVYTPVIGTVLNLGANQNLKVDFTPTDIANYNTTTKTVTINVIAKKIPVITWKNPSDITFGTLLSATQLNATADVAGTFTYTPTIGTKLNEGANQNLKVNFTPTNIPIFDTVSKTVKINVTHVYNGTITDIDGNIYNVITIGTQTWMAENLKVTKYRNGDIIGTTTPATLDISSESSPKYQWAYDGNLDNVPVYGRLYTWYALMDNRNICPAGWHIPTEAEWETLTNYLINNGYGYGGNGDDIAKSMAATSGWRLDTIGGNIGKDQGSNNYSGFTAFPSGYRVSGRLFNFKGNYCFWWSSSENYIFNAWEINLGFNFNYVDKGSHDKYDGLSVRCVKDL